MSARAFCARRGPGEQKLLGVESDEEEDCLRRLSLCPACDRACDGVLLLPCSHATCARCIAAAEGTRSGQPRRRGAGPAGCSVPCPRCRHPVELPCRTWSSATSCLPLHPGPSPAWVGGETNGEEEASETGNSYGRDAAGDATARSLSRGSNAASCPVAPVEGGVDLLEEEMERSVFGLRFALDPSTVPPSLHLSNSSLTVTYRGESPVGPPPDDEAGPSTTSDPGPTPALPQVCADVAVARGQYYWEVDVCNSSVYKIGVSPLDGSGGWWLERRGSSFCAVYDGSREPLRTVPPRLKTLGVFLNIGGGALSFHNPLTREHLATLPTRFDPAGVLPALGLGHGRLRLRCGLPPPRHVFLGQDSAYRGLHVAGEGRWRRGEVPFQSVRKAIRKFEELAESDSGSGPASCSTLGFPSRSGFSWGRSPSGEAGQETRAAE